MWHVNVSSELRGNLKGRRLLCVMWWWCIRARVDFAARVAQDLGVCEESAIVSQSKQSLNLSSVTATLRTVTIAHVLVLHLVLARSHQARRGQ